MLRGHLTVRRREPGDWDGFRAAYESVAAEGRWILGELPVDWDSRKATWDERTASDQHLNLVVDDGGRIVGWLSVDLQPSGRAELGMGVVDGYRDRGLGAELLGAAVTWAREAGAHKVVLELWPDNGRARRLYEKHGFVLEGRHRRHWRRNDGSLWDCLAMGLVLDDDAPGGPPASAEGTTARPV